MSEKPKYLTLEFWAAVLSGAAMVVVALGLLSQEEAENWVALLLALVTAVLPIAALVLGYGQARAEAVRLGLMVAETPSYLTLEFWMTLAATAVMVLVAARIVTQEQADLWLKLLGPLVAAVLGIVAYVRGRLQVKVAVVEVRARLISGR